MSLLKKAFAEDPEKIAIWTTLSVVCPLIPVVLAAADVAGVAGRAVAKGAKALTPAPKPEPSRALVPVKPKAPVKKEPEVVPYVDPVDLVQREYIAIQERICRLPLDDEDKQDLHTVAENRFMQNLKERINGWK